MTGTQGPGEVPRSHLGLRNSSGTPPELLPYSSGGIPGILRNTAIYCIPGNTVTVPQVFAVFNIQSISCLQSLSYAVPAD